MLGVQQGGHNPTGRGAVQVGASEGESLAANGRAGECVRQLGTVGGVFVPNVLTILGVIMFLRAGWVVGSAGLAAIDRFVSQIGSAAAAREESASS